MALSFTHSTKRISVPQVDAQPLLVQTLINAIRAEEASERGITYDQIAEASGKNSLGGAVQTGITVALLSTWKLDFAAGAYQATIDGGNVADVLARVNNTGSPQVVALSSAAATLVETGVSGLTAGESANLARVVTVEKILRNKQITNPVTGKMVVYDDDDATVLLQGDLFEDAAGTIPYRGQGAERRGRLT